MKLERVAFDEIPAEIQTVVEDFLRDDEEVFDVIVSADRNDGSINYNIRAASISHLVGIFFNSEVGLIRAGRVSLSDVMAALEKVPHFATLKIR
jgi:hypothetical protein